MFTAFVASNIVLSPVFGTMGDLGTLPRRVIIIVGALIWCAATSLSGLCNSFVTLLIPRLFVGAGEASITTLGVSLLCDSFPKRRHNLILAVFFACIPIGSALGYIVSSQIGQHLNWRWAFFVAGLPGVLCFLLLLCGEPRQGAQEAAIADAAAAEAADAAVPSVPNDELPAHPARNFSWGEMWASLRAIFTSAPYMYGLIGYIFVLQGMGVVSDWLSSYAQRYYGLTPGKAGIVGGAMLVVGGLGGTLVGGGIASLLNKVMAKPQLLLCSVSVGVATVFAALSLLVGKNMYVGFSLLFVATFTFSFMNVPVGELMNNCLHPDVRSRANGFKILLTHVFGDAISPPIVGAISDRTHGDLRHAMLLIPASFFVCSVIWLVGWFATGRRPTPLSYEPLLGISTSAGESPAVLSSASSEEDDGTAFPTSPSLTLRQVATLSPQ